MASRVILIPEMLPSPRPQVRHGLDSARTGLMLTISGSILVGALLFASLSVVTTASGAPGAGPGPAPAPAPSLVTPGP